MRETFGDRVRKRRREIGLSLQEAAAKLGATSRETMFLEASDSRPTRTQFESCNRVLELGYLSYEAYQFGVALTAAIEAVGISRSVLDEKIGVSKSHRNFFERGGRLPSAGDQALLERELGVELPALERSKFSHTLSAKNQALLAEAYQTPDEAWAILEIYRLQNELTQAAMADKSGMSYASYRKFIARRRGSVRDVFAQEDVTKRIGLVLPLKTSKGPAKARRNGLPSDWVLAHTGSRFSLIRLACNLTIEEVAERAGVKSWTVTSVELHNEGLMQVKPLLYGMGFSLNAILASSLEEALRLRLSPEDLWQASAVPIASAKRGAFAGSTPTGSAG